MDPRIEKSVARELVIADLEKQVASLEKQNAAAKKVILRLAEQTVNPPIVYSREYYAKLQEEKEKLRRGFRKIFGRLYWKGN